MIFLNRDLEEKIYMYWLEGYISEDKESLIYKLFEILYKFNQFPKTWYKKVEEYFNSQSLKRIYIDPKIYVLRNTNGFIIITLYIDNWL